VAPPCLRRHAGARIHDLAGCHVGLPPYTSMITGITMGLRWKR
jgi:hypothetical protein